MDNPRLDCRRIASSLWKRPEARITVATKRLSKGYRRGRPWCATVASPPTEGAAYNSPDRVDLSITADNAATEHAALVALRDVLLRDASNAAVGCDLAKARWETLGREEGERAEMLRALVTAVQQGGAA